jgi:hypothetical protein
LLSRLKNVKLELENFVRKINNLLRLILIVLGLSYSQTNFSYPNWFFNPPFKSHAVGYSLNDINDSLDAQNRLTAYKSLVVEGSRNNYQKAGRLLFSHQKDDIILYPFTPLVNQIDTNQFKFLDRIKMGSQTVVIASSSQIKISNRKVALDSLDTIKTWVTQRLQPRAGKFYGMGVKKFSRWNEAASWLACDENAVVNLAQQAKSKTYELVRHYNSKFASDFEKIIGQDVRILLEDVRITERWLDKKTWTCFCKAVATPKALPALMPEVKEVVEQVDSNSTPQNLLDSNVVQLDTNQTIKVDSILIPEIDTLKLDSINRVENLKRELGLASQPEINLEKSEDLVVPDSKPDESELVW